MEEKKFNKSKYDMELRKKLEKKQFCTDLDKDVYLELNNLLKENGLSKAEFLRIGTKLLKEGRFC